MLIPLPSSLILLLFWKANEDFKPLLFKFQCVFLKTDFFMILFAFFSSNLIQCFFLQSLTLMKNAMFHTRSRSY